MPARSIRRPTTITVREATVGPLLGTSAGIRRSHCDVVVADADSLGGNLREHSVCALAKFRVRYQHAHFAFGRNVHSGQRIRECVRRSR
jgi:hypothetical protein